MQHNGSRVIMKYTDVYGIIRFIHARAVASIGPLETIKVD